ncbi:unnamed protein product [Chironomus riparius]|uniref:Uncharacterized protein n=1 Tax=Chironomus riparius TaxID=315576 RepID=A0A9P0NQD5_9DIPT|nr:unnamed protein product [Chironomus riparius]
MCRVRNFLCCLSLENGGTFLGYMHFLFGLMGFITTSVIAMWILAKHQRFVLFLAFVAFLLFFLAWILCSWCLIEGVKNRESSKVFRFKLFSIVCLIMKFIGLVAVLSLFFEIIHRKLEADNKSPGYIGPHHYGHPNPSSSTVIPYSPHIEIIILILWEIYILIFVSSLEKKFQKEELHTKIIHRHV